MGDVKNNMESTFKKLDLFVPTVDKVHGNHHEEFHEVRSIYENIRQKVKESSNDVDLNDEFKRLREITDDFKVPSDVCESYEAVFTMLQEVEKEYKK